MPDVGTARGYLLRLACLATAPWIGSACSTAELHSDEPWVPLEEFDAALPDAVRVYGLVDERLRLRAFCVRADLSSPEVSGHVVVADDEDLRETVSSLAEQEGACVAVNAGFFDRGSDVAVHEGLLRVESGWVGEVRGLGGALGFDAAGRPDIAWARGTPRALAELPAATPRPGQLVSAPALPEDPPEWPMRSLVQSKPVLVLGGVAYRQHHVVREPRTAAGVTASGELVLVVVDGRQARSRGATLDELAAMMVELGCVEALNLDGGGSSALVVGGRLVNRPVGGREEREVMSAVVLRRAR